MVTRRPEDGRGLAEGGRLERREAEVLVRSRNEAYGGGVEPAELRVNDFFSLEFLDARSGRGQLGLAFGRLSRTIFDHLGRVVRERILFLW